MKRVEKKGLSINFSLVFVNADISQTLQTDPDLSTYAYSAH